MKIKLMKALDSYPDGTMAYLHARRDESSSLHPKHDDKWRKPVLATPRQMGDGSFYAGLIVALLATAAVLAAVVVVFR